MRQFAKLLARNDVGETGSHQAGILVPKTNRELLEFFPPLDARERNPDAWIVCVDDAGAEWKLRFVYYNGRLHGAGTRNEYRLTYLTEYMRINRARAGDSMLFSSTDDPGRYRITLVRKDPAPDVGVIALRGWRRVH